MTNKEIALSYLNNGLSIIPLYSPSLLKRKPPKKFTEKLNKKLAENAQSENPLSKEEIIRKAVIGQCKVPAIWAWTDYQKRQPTKDEVNQWFDENPDANIAIVTGTVSGIVAFDLDSEHAVEYAKEQGGFPDTVKVKTGKGYHYYVQYPAFDVGNSVNSKLGIDIRGEDGYVAAPPSIHGSGRIYEWEEGHSIDEIDPAPCKPWMIDFLENNASRSKPAKEMKREPKPSNTVDKASKSEKNNEYTDILNNGAVEGMRNHTATKLAGHLLANSIPEDEAWSMLKIWNSDKNNPSLDETELRRTFDSIAKLESKNQKQEKKIDVADFLDSSNNVVSEFTENYNQIPFARKDLSQLEAHMNGGLVGGRFYLLGGIPSASKTMLTNIMADNICLNDQPVLFFSYDDGRSELRYRTFARFSSHGIEDFNQNRLNNKELKAVCEIPEIKKIMGLKYVVENMINIEKWNDLIEQIKQRHQKAPVIMIDYLRKLRTDNKTSDERLRVDDILSNLTGLAKKHNIPVVVISELARDSYKSGQRLSMASLKESGNLEYEASWLGILAAVEEINGRYILKDDWEKIIEQDGNVDLIVFKTKRGTGITGKIPLKVDKNKMIVSDRMDGSKIDTVSAMQKQSMFGKRGN